MRPEEISATPERQVDMTGHAKPDLGALYAPPSERIQKAVLDRLIDFHVAYLKKATFFCLATGSERGLDASPRGGPPGFVHVLDPQTIAYADWPGNNRIESMRNLECDERMGMLFLFPGLEIFMRINGRGMVTANPALLARLSEDGRQPKTATVVRIDEVLMHCGKAVHRARLWEVDARLDQDALPTVGQFMAALSELEGAPDAMGASEIQQMDAHYRHAVRNDLY